MAREGKEWRSPIFDLGTAKATSDIPAPKKITRKSPRQNTRASIDDREGTATSEAHGTQDSVLGAGGATTSYTSSNSGGYDSASRNTGNCGSQSTSDGFERGSPVRVTDISLE